MKTINSEAASCSASFFFDSLRLRWSSQGHKWANDFRSYYFLSSILIYWPLDLIWISTWGGRGQHVDVTTRNICNLQSDSVTILAILFDCEPWLEASWPYLDQIFKRSFKKILQVERSFEDPSDVPALGDPTKDRRIWMSHSRGWRHRLEIHPRDVTVITWPESWGFVSGFFLMRFDWSKSPRRRSIRS